MDRHWDENARVLLKQVQFPLEVANYFAQINLPFITKMIILPTLCNYWKTLVPPNTGKRKDL